MIIFILYFFLPIKKSLSQKYFCVKLKIFNLQINFDKFLFNLNE